MMVERGVVNRVAAPLALILLAAAMPARAEDGHALWLRYAPLEGEALERLRAFRGMFYAETHDPTTAVAANELHRGLAMLRGESGDAPFIIVNAFRVAREAERGSVALNCRDAGMPGGGAFRAGVESGVLRVIAAEPIGCLYGVHALLRELSLGRDPATIDLDEAPAMPLRLLNHWDNPDGSVERGYSGRSIFDWWRLPDHLDARLIDYARANASVGINGTVVNNVNASPLFLTDRYIPKLKRVADALRPYGIRVYISARFSAPVEVGGLATADPLDPAVQAWWKARADALYAAIPDFGGFLVKANSEGQPGPQDYGRSHADGANTLARAIGPRGTVIWRAFVYSAEDQTDRAKQAYNEFVPLDRKFDDNVIVQVKNGPIDFQPREPFHPLFGAMPNTRLMLEAQITKEYLGFATHLVFLAPMWEETLDADTGRGGTVAQIVKPVGMAGVANTGSDRNWSGSHFDQANWYAFGRLAWNPDLPSEQIAREWAAQTFSRAEPFIEAVVPMMLGSRQAAVDYMTPLGLSHLMATGHHYGPGPWVCDLARPEWNPCYYHKADADGIGFDRTASGSNALAQYAPSVAAGWSDPRRIDPDYLLWFHHVPWDFRVKSGQPLWNELVARYDRGVAAVDRMAATWAAQEAYVDAPRFADVADFLRIQQAEARWWRDASIAYWQSVNGLSLPRGARPPEHSLEHYKSLTFAEAPGN
jgi:alpha-glucuronidase